MSDCYHILHVEDEDIYATIEEGHYSGLLKEPVEDALRYYGVESNEIRWTLAQTQEEALAQIDHAAKEREGRGFDAIFVDLQIPASKSAPKSRDWRHGFAVLQHLRNYDWPGPIIVTSTFSERDDVLDEKGVRQEAVRIDEWLGKKKDFEIEGDGSFLEARRHVVAKLRRFLVPIENYAEHCAENPPHALFIHSEMKRLLGRLVYLARREYRCAPLASFLLVGEAGAGKSLLAEVFESLLPTPGQGFPPRPRLESINCASLVAQAHGGRIALFGARNFQGMRDQPGIFERATCYAARDPRGFAVVGRGEREGSPIVQSAGVVFLDEFALLDPDLQASILTVLSKGEIRREGDYSTVPIACHVVFATNRDPVDLVANPGRAVSRGEDRIRHDLVDRIPYVYTVPPLRDRPPSEIQRVITHLAIRRRQEQGEPNAYVTVTPSAAQLVTRAIRLGLITGFRQLQSIADVELGETTISDGNLLSLFAKAEALGLREALTVSPEMVSLADQAVELGLPSQLCREDLPTATQQVIRCLFARKRGDQEVSPDKEIRFSSGDQEECRNRFRVTAILLTRDVRAQTYSGNDEAIRARARRTLVDIYGINKEDLATDERKSQFIIRILLSEPT